MSNEHGATAFRGGCQAHQILAVNSEAQRLDRQPIAPYPIRGGQSFKVAGRAGNVTDCKSDAPAKGPGSIPGATSKRLF